MRWVQAMVVSPVFDDLPRMAVTGDEVLVVAGITQTSVEAFREAILHRFARRDVVSLDGAVPLPFEVAFDVSSVPLSDTTVPG